tara:strand:- start:732 stop:1487 length:756 start_codon:yes stop_codon:yes gene_type:complete
MTTTVTQGHRGSFNEILPEDNDTWGDFSSSPYGTWSNWTTWHPNPKDLEITLLDDQGSVDIRQPILILNHAGTASIVLNISETGTFTGEQTTVDLSDLTAKSYVRGRYYRWSITIAADIDYPAPFSGEPIGGYNIEPVVEVLNDVDVPSTGTDSSGFTLIPNSLGLIQNVQATALQGDPYFVTEYVQTAAEEAVAEQYVGGQLGGVAVVESKSPLAIKVVDYTGVPWDGTVDLVLRGLPKIQQTATGVAST